MILKSTLIASALALAPFAAFADDYTIDPEHTLVLFKVNHVGFSTSLGWFGDISGTISYNPDDVAASSVTASIATASVNTNHDHRDGWIKSDQVLNAEANPAITFISTGVEQTSDTTGKIMGNLTMNGQTLPVTLDAQFRKLGENPINKKQTLGVSAVATLKRSEWGVNAFVGPLGDDVSIEIELEAIKDEG